MSLRGAFAIKKITKTEGSIVSVYSPFSCGGHVKSQENKSFFFLPSKLVFKFFTARLDGQNVLCLCKTAAACSKSIVVYCEDAFDIGLKR